MTEETKELSNCCNYEMIPPDWDMAEEMGSLWRAYACYICKKCHKPCEPKPIENENKESKN